MYLKCATFAPKCNEKEYEVYLLGYFTELNIKELHRAHHSYLVMNNMRIEPHFINDTKIAELISDNTIILTSDDGLNLLGNLYYLGYDKVILFEKNITPAFFDLENGMAGEILQKFSNYHVRLAIVGSFIKYTKKSIKDFIFESNSRKQINFVPSASEAIKVLSTL